MRKVNRRGRMTATRQSRSLLLRQCIVVYSFLKCTVQLTHASLFNAEFSSEMMLPVAPLLPPLQPNDDDDDLLSFYVIGDVPYSDMEACMLPYELDKLRLEQGHLLFHLGDIRAGRLDPATGQVRPCPETVFTDIAAIFADSVPSNMTCFFLPGDNAWLDCADPVEAHGFWEAHLFDYHERTDFGARVHKWDTFPAGTFRSTHRPELFSLFYRDVLFVGLSLPGRGRTDGHPWDPRDDLLRDNVQWTRDNLDAHYADDDSMRAVVLLGHSASSSANDDYFDKLEGIADEYSDIPILVLEDGHFFAQQTNFRGVPNMMRIASDDTVTPMTVTVDPDGSGLQNIFRYDRRCPCSTDHTPTRYVTYDLGDECHGECTLPQSSCEDENRCFPGLDTC